MMIRAVVTDIEGTTTSLSFVKEVLFPCSKKQMEGFVHRHGAEPAVVSLLEGAKAAVDDKTLPLEKIIAQLHARIDADAKVTALKALQGLLWQEGYRRGDFTGHLYPDAECGLRAWWEAGFKLYVFSSGSVQAQKLLFTHSSFGDLTPLFEGYFDTRIGAKQEADSYRRIAESIGVTPQETLFLSDVKAELDAAARAGMKAVWLVREGTLDSAAPHLQVSNFDSIKANLL